MDYLGSKPRFDSLSLADLLRAREQFHAHLLHKANVVGTAIGRYLIRSDPYPKRDDATAARRVRQEDSAHDRELRSPRLLVAGRDRVRVGVDRRRRLQCDAAKPTSPTTSRRRSTSTTAAACRCAWCWRRSPRRATADRSDGAHVPSASTTGRRCPAAIPCTSTSRKGVTSHRSDASSPTGTRCTR